MTPTEQVQANFTTLGTSLTALYAENAAQATQISTLTDQLAATNAKLAAAAALVAQLNALLNPTP